MEIIGLAIILILVVVGLLFFAYSNQRKVDPKQDLIDTQMSQSMLNAMMQSTTDCGPDLFRTLQDCYGKNDLCGGDSCGYAESKIAEIMEGTLNKWKKPYMFYAEADGERMLELSEECSDLSEKLSTGLYFIQEDEKTIIVSLNICKV
jgi:hypothetical protein